MLITDPSDNANPSRSNLAELTDDVLIGNCAALANAARESTAELIAHLVELERRNLHLACGFSSLYGYCREVLLFSEPETYQRMQAVNVARKFPVVLPLLANGRLHLAGLRLLAPHLDDENHLALIGAAVGQSKRNIEKLLARWFPQPDVPTSIRKVSAPRPAAPAVASAAAAEDSGELGAAAPAGPGAQTGQPAAPVSPQTRTSTEASPSDGSKTRAAAHSTAKPAVHIVPLSEARYYVKLTAPEAMIGRLRQAQELLSHAIPDGDIVAGVPAKSIKSKVSDPNLFLMAGQKRSNSA